jgi:CRISPR system Cascade subunit CasE
MCFDDGQALRFRLVTNPTRKIDTKTGSDGAKRNGRRVPVPVDQLFPWLSKRAELLGFSVDEGSTAVQPGYAYFKKSPREKEEEARLRSVCYDGVLNVIDPNMFKGAITSGIGPGKSLGFGLLSVAPVEST